KLHIPIAVITNASLLNEKQVREDLKFADWISIKIDANVESSWKAINRPMVGLDFEKHVEGMLKFVSEYKGKLVTETMLVEGINDSSQLFYQTSDFIKQINPSIAYISIPTRPPALLNVKVPTEFVINEALKVKYGASGLNIEVGSLYSALVGGVTVVTPNKDANKIGKEEVYTLFANKDDLRKKEYFHVNFQKANGIEENSAIIYKGIEIGRVLSVGLNNDILQTKAYVYEDYKYLLTTNTKFFVEEPNISLSGVENLGNIVKGNFLSLVYKEGTFNNIFNAIDKKDINKNSATVKLELYSENLNSISEKSKIYYKNIEVGKVNSYSLTSDLKKVKIVVSIDDQYKDLINDHILFYDMSSKLVEMKALDLNINYSGVEPLLNGAIGIVGEKRNEKLTKKEFKLYSSYKDVEKLKKVYNTGITIDAFFDNDFEIKPNMAIIYKNQEIGFVKDIDFDDRRSTVSLFIYTPFQKYITNKSRFYKKGIVNLKASLNGVLFEVDNFTSLLEGSIHLDTDSPITYNNYEVFSSEDAMKNSSNSINIVFDNVEGVQENFSQLTYKGVNVGKVTKISLNKDQSVEVKAILYDDYASFAKEGTVYYLKKPRISLQEIANVGSAVMAVNIGVIKSTSSKIQTRFEGLEDQPSVEKSHLGIVFQVEDNTASSVNVDAPVYYKNVQI
ncbi:MAG: MCE family protein, partial [Erysipelotrichia bacterium]|nr:MCE family protein [Erysipelotrichia bacterium]